jgi:hypothetical protein
MATAIVELAKAREADLTLFLVEEPEAHLHPKLQMLVLDFLLAQAQKSASATCQFRKRIGWLSSGRARGRAIQGAGAQDRVPMPDHWGGKSRSSGRKPL